MIFYATSLATFTFPADKLQWILLQEQELYVHCDTSTGPVAIELPAISSMNGFYNVKIYIVDTGGNASGNNITISCDPGNVIDSGGVVVINNDLASVALTVVSDFQWISVEGVVAVGASIADLGKMLFVSVGSATYSVDAGSNQFAVYPGACADKIANGVQLVSTLTVSPNISVPRPKPY